MITFTTPASVSGVAQEGQLLTALGQVDDSMATITYQWQENINLRPWQQPRPTP
jgi:hypothetical protein